jgi:predicted esterase
LKKLCGILLLLGLCLQSCSDSDSNDPVFPLATGEQTVMSNGVARRIYLKVPADYGNESVAKPLLFAYHGTGGSYDLWLNGFYDLTAAVGDDAIVVLMQALPDGNGVNQWNYDYDFQYFEDVLAFIRPRLRFDENRIFVTGHSSGGGMAHELGCNYGDVIRGIAPHAGILRSAECTGAVAVFQTHGLNDTLVPWGTGESGHQFWTLYNGFERASSIPGIESFCIDHSLGGSPYPVQWCLHSEGQGASAHNWPSFASEATWQFFSSLDPVTPDAQPPAGGGNDKVADLVDTTFSFTLSFPPGIGEVTQGAVSIYPGGTQQPLSGGPSSILLLAFDPGDVAPGSVVSYEVPIKYVSETFPGTYAFSVVMYVADGGNPIPLPGKDLIVLQDVDVVDRNLPVIIDNVLELETIFF